MIVIPNSVPEQKQVKHKDFHHGHKIDTFACFICQTGIVHFEFQWLAHI